MDALTYAPIDADAKYGNTQLVKLGPTIAAAWWTGDMWAYRGTREQLDFDPTHYAVLASGTEARQRPDPEEGLDPKGDGPTAESGDAQTPTPSSRERK